MFRSEEQQREYDADMEQASMTQGEYMSAALYQYSAAHGADRPEDRWILSPFDTWENNPCWDGTDPNQPHPEDEYAIQEYYVVGQHAVNLYEAHLADLEPFVYEPMFTEEEMAADADLPF